MKRFLVLVVILITTMGLAFGQTEQATAVAQEQPHLSINIEPMYMGVWMNESVTHVGDIYKSKQEGAWTWTWNPTTQRWTGSIGVNYGAQYEPLNHVFRGTPLVPGNIPVLDYLKAVRPEIVLRASDWGIGASGWWFGAGSHLEGIVSTPKSSWSNSYTNNTYSYNSAYYVDGVRFWNQDIMPVINDFTASGLSDQNYAANMGVTVYTADAFLLRTLAEKSGSIEMTLGGKLLNLVVNRDETVKMKSHHTQWYYDTLGNPLYYNIWDNNITVGSAGSATYNMLLGPVVGLRGEANTGLVGIQGFINQGVVFGTMNLGGLFTDIDDAVSNYYSPSNNLLQTYNMGLSGKFPFSKTGTVVIPITEAKANVLLNFGNLSIGAGGFLSILWNVPVVPAWNMPGNWSWTNGSGFVLQETNIVFWGASAIFRIAL